MSVEERLDRLEQRLEVVEALMRDVLRGRSPIVEGPAPGLTAVKAATPAIPKPPPPAPAWPTPAPASRTGPSFLNPEEWIGQRGLLAVGVLALILAAGYLLKLSFERGWISPFVRCVGGVVAGGVVGAIGWRLLGRYRTYGASLIGCGAAIIYLAVWAAAKLYGLLPPATGIGGLALVSFSLAAIAYAIGVEALGTTAALGAFVAPVLLGKRGNPDALLIYLAAAGLALGWVAAQKRWRTTAAVVALSFFGLGWSGSADSRHPMGALGYAMFGGAGGIYLGLRERWWETRFLSSPHRFGGSGSARGPGCRCGSCRPPRERAGPWAKRSTSCPPRSSWAGRCAVWPRTCSRRSGDWRPPQWPSRTWLPAMCAPDSRSRWSA